MNDQSTKCLSNHDANAATKLATGNVTTHAIAILRNTFHDTPPSLDFTHPTQTTAPTMQCVVLIGMPILLATKTVKAVPNSIAKPLKNNDCHEETRLICIQRTGRYLGGVTSVIFVPIVDMTLWPSIQRPMIILSAPNRIK